MNKRVKRLSLHKETLRSLTDEHLHGVAGGFITQVCPCSKTCDSCSPCTLGQSCVAG
ncbi:MAG: class I lanthipeptide [Acidobacteria bacterium]|nr:class I lanthipeptide [Acidobacteriota bacterium]